MIFHPGILALLTGNLLTLLMVTYACLIGAQIIYDWDFSSTKPKQIIYERRTYLLSTIINYALLFQIISLFLFLYTIDDIHPLFVGAMCATGALNANPIGWYAFGTKILIFFGAAGWIALNYLDQRAADFPLVKLKTWLLFILLPVFAGDLYLTASYFWGLEPEIITSCCGSLFSSRKGKVASDLASLPIQPMMWLFYIVSGITIALSGTCLKLQASLWRYLLAAAGITFFLVAAASLVSFISIYIYELPTHHCPFDIIQKNYSFIGYPLYAGILGGTLFSLLPAMGQLCKKIPSLHDLTIRTEKTWCLTAASLLLLFLLLSTWIVVFSKFSSHAYM